MMTPEQYAAIQDKTAPLLEKPVKVLNELEDLSGWQPVIAHEAQIITVGGTVYRGNEKWEIEPR